MWSLLPSTTCMNVVNITFIHYMWSAVLGLIESCHLMLCKDSIVSVILVDNTTRNLIICLNENSSIL